MVLSDDEPGYKAGKLARDSEFWEAANPSNARRRLLEALRIELLGPESGEELLSESPLTHYVAGTLAPFGTEVPDEERGDEVDGSAGDESDGGLEGSSPVSEALTPSSIGLSCLISARNDTIDVTISWGDYAPEEVEEPETESQQLRPSPASGTSPASGQSDQPRRRRRRTHWRRIACKPAPLQVRLLVGAGLQRQVVPDHPGISIESVSRMVGNHIAVSVFLVNRRIAPKDARPPIDLWIFQPELAVRTKAEGGGFLPRELEPSLTHSDRDRDSNRLLFRRRREFAIGHGCAVEWTMAADNATAEEVRTELIPFYELPRVDAPALTGAVLDMRELAEVGSAHQLSLFLEPLLDLYSKWIDSKRDEVASLEHSLQATAQAHLDECLNALRRMRRGLDLLEADRDAFESFRFANRAMLLQRSHTLWSRDRRRDGEKAPNEPTMIAEWRPFQIAFILLNLPALIDPASIDREIGDLLWFPTGGGKTEAYLGLSAFALALRRRRAPSGLRTDAGTTVLMRYTLRLLTIQQFQRAATLICACESLRVKDVTTWGGYRFSLGLWLGMEATPNTHAASRDALHRLQSDPSEEGANPCVLESCPWCGESLTSRDYWTDGEAVRTRVACPRAGCDFSTAKNALGIPVVVVDEEIYRECPSLLIATVDKFAQMPWNGEVQSLFGIVDRECGRCGFLTPASEHPAFHRQTGTAKRRLSARATERLAPPDLIIQDELHLISGPLGTLVGLYESAIDHLCTRQIEGRSVGPKLVASTATVRRAFEQVQSIFERSLSVFPPPGLDPDDSFFALEHGASAASPGRLYVGVCAPGKSMATAYVRVAALLFVAAAGLRDKSIFAEPFLTLVSYFNSLRELGGAIRLMDDDVPARIDQLRRADLPPRQRPVYVELTSRIRQEAIPVLLRRLEQRFDAEHKEGDPLPLDAVLASNMISVGVDIDRLGLMIVRGQPKTTAEYIQATSRVGRQPWGPGLVVTIYNWSRPRDLSHYERFAYYHATLYRNVEAVSATPFSSRALDRGLRGTVVGMMRLGVDSLSPETAAAGFQVESREFARACDALCRRAAAVAGAQAASSLAVALKGLGDEWRAYAQRALRYGWRSPDNYSVPAEDVLLRVPETGRFGHWPAPQSLREVEELSYVRVLNLDA